ncbi:MAG TPA: hypothetical protein VJP87_05095 [Candidatus Acidoferrales bacterium]|nr:hypothetical protein [Candidatus Acidoferrales bacterium]
MKSTLIAPVAPLAPTGGIMAALAVAAVLASLAFFFSPALGQQKSAPVALENLDLHNVKSEQVTYRGRRALRITDAAPPNLDDAGRLAIIPRTSFQDGTIAVDLAGDTAPDAPPRMRGFVGIAFRVDPQASRFECFYLRPKNGRSEDQLQRNHSAQYISFPGFGWEKLRTETPGKYESYVDLVPGQWTRVRIQVAGSLARLYVNGAEQPVLVVNDLKQPSASGAVALWVGTGTIAHFSNLTITR